MHFEIVIIHPCAVATHYTRVQHRMNTISFKTPLQDAGVLKNRLEKKRKSRVSFKTQIMFSRHLSRRLNEFSRYPIKTPISRHPSRRSDKIYSTPPRNPKCFQDALQNFQDATKSVLKSIQVS